MKDKEDTRIVSFGIRYILDNYISKQWTMEDVERADLFYKYGQHVYQVLMMQGTVTVLGPTCLPACLPACLRTHMAPMYTEFPYPRHLFEKFVRENNGGECRS